MIKIQEVDNFGNSEEDRFESYEKIGEGVYGIVYKGFDRESKKTVAIKQIKFQNETEGIPYTALREITILRNLNHPNIVRYFAK